MAFALNFNIGNQGAIPNYGDLLAAFKASQPSVITATGAGPDTLLGYQMMSGFYQRSGATAAVAVTTDTAANIIASLQTGTQTALVGQGFLFFYTNQNTSAGVATITGGTGVTMQGNVVIPIGGTHIFTGTVTSATTVTINGAVLLSGNTLTPTEVNTAITTVGAGTLTAAGISGQLITRSGPVAAYTDTTDTAANIVAAIPDAAVGQSFEITLKNTVPFIQTLAGGTGVTLSGISVIPANTSLHALVTLTSLTAVSILGISILPLTVPTLEVVTALNTVGAGTVTGAGIAGGVTTRGGAQAGSAFTDTTDTAANIIAAQPSANVGQSWEWTYQNNTNAVATFANGTGVTVSAITVVPANTFARFLVTYTAAATVTIVGIAMGQNAAIPTSQFVTISSGNGTLAAGQMEGASYCTLATSGATAFTTRTAAQIIAQIANAQVGMTYIFRVYNTNGGTLTLTGGTGVTITGTATIATNVTRDYQVSITGAATVTMQNIGAGNAT